MLKQSVRLFEKHCSTCLIKYLLFVCFSCQRSICRRMYDENDDPSDVEEIANIRGFDVEEKLVCDIYTSHFVHYMDGRGMQYK